MSMTLDLKSTFRFENLNKKFALPPPQCGDIGGETGFEICERNFDKFMKTGSHKKMQVAQRG